MEKEQNTVVVFGERLPAKLLTLDYVRRKTNVNVVRSEKEVKAFMSHWLRQRHDYSKETLQSWAEFVELVLVQHRNLKGGGGGAAEKQQREQQRDQQQLLLQQQTLAAQRSTASGVPGSNQLSRRTSVKPAYLQTQQLKSNFQQAALGFPGGGGVGGGGGGGKRDKHRAEVGITLEPGNPREFAEVLDELAEDALISGHKQLSVLKRTIDRSRVFMEMVYAVLGRVEATATEMERYCLSFCTESVGLELQPVLAYENAVVDFRSKISAALERIKKVVQIYRQVESPFKEYILSYNAAIECMREISKHLLICCDVIKRWVQEDEAYCSRIDREVIRLSELRANNRRQESEANARSASVAQTATRQEFEQVKNSRLFADKIRRRKSVHGESKSSRKRLAEIQQGFQARRMELGKMTESMRKRINGGFTKAYREACGRTDSLTRELRSLGREKTELECDLSSARTEQKALVSEMTLIQREHENLKLCRANTTADLRTQHESRDFFREQIDRLARMVRALQRIKAMKLDPATMRTIHAANGYYPTTVQRLQTQEVFHKAADITAQSIGTKWHALYKRLPFRPERTQSARIRDMIEMTQGELDTCFLPEVAAKSLDAWKARSEEVTLSQLLYTLREIRQPRVVRRVELGLKIPANQRPAKAPVIHCR